MQLPANLWDHLCWKALRKWHVYDQIHEFLKLSGYTYRKSVQVAKNVKLPQNVGGCNCKGTCVDSKTCACARLNGFNFPYVHLDGGKWGTLLINIVNFFQIHFGARWSIEQYFWLIWGYFRLFPFRLVEANDVDFECGPQCGCGPDCVNRTSQKELNYWFEVDLNF